MTLKIRIFSTYFYGNLRGFYGFLRVGKIRGVIYGYDRVKYGIKYGHFQVLRIFTGVMCLDGDGNPLNSPKFKKKQVKPAK